VSIRFSTSKILNPEVPAALRRLAAVAVVASFVAVAAVYSRDGNAPTVPPASKQAFVQTMDRVQAEGRFIPTVNVAELSDSKGPDIATAYPLPRPRPMTPGYYYELARAQGDGEEGEYVLVERQCRPNIDMPEPCYLPERERRDFPLRRE
jgi:hypothetical protein